MATTPARKVSALEPLTVSQCDAMYHIVTRMKPSAATPQDPPSSVRKERVVHTRVPEVLDRELKRFAANLRVPVSNLIRTILEDAVSVADVAGGRVGESLKSAARSIDVERERLKQRMHADQPSDIFAYQAVTLAVPATCARCRTALHVGSVAHLGLSDAPSGLPKVFVCPTCIAAAQQEPVASSPPKGE